MEIVIDWILERHKIFVRRLKGEEPPWTDDPLFLKRSFTNVFRVLDPGTQYAIKLLSHPDEQVAFYRLMLYRTFNKPQIYERIRDSVGPIYPSTKFGHIVEALESGPRPYFHGGFCSGVGAHPYNLPTLAESVYGDWFLQIQDMGLEETVKFFLRQTGMGDFRSYQLALDLSYVCPRLDTDSFVKIGPGAVIGLGLVYPELQEFALKGPGGHLRKMKRTHQHRFLDALDELHEGVLADERSPRIWGRPPSKSDIQNVMCEVGKYLRGWTKTVHRYGKQLEHPIPPPAWGIQTHTRLLTADEYSPRLQD